jgi:serine/threonine-protein kinase
MPLSAGARLGPYEIIAPLGAGGMGEVYRATDTKLGRDVALKILPASFTSDPERVARFRREAQVLASLNHSHIAQIYGLDEAGGTQFLVLELVDGESLDTRIARGPIPVEEALGIAGQIAEALEAAHEKGIIHRDLKPANIAQTSDGQVKVLDFGLAKAVETLGGSSDLMNSPTITSPAMMTGVGVILGTAAYMAPEQAKGRAADKRSDIWALGCVLYEMLTGTRAFDGDDVTDTLANVLKTEPDWNALPANVGERTRALLRRCLDRDRDRRVSDAAVVRFVVTEPEPSASATAASPSKARWKHLVSIAAAVLATAGAAWFFVSNKRSPELAVMRFRDVLPAGQRFTGRSDVVAVSRDGQRIAYAARDGGAVEATQGSQVAQLYVRSLAETDPHPIPGTSLDVMSPVFSPDGQSIAFYSFQDRTFKKVPLSGGVPTTICKAEPHFGVTWDGDWIVFADPVKGILRVSQNGGEPQVLVPRGPGESFGGPQMLDQGRAILFTVASVQGGAERWDEGQVVIQAVGSTDRTVVLRGGSEGRYLPTGHLVYMTGDTLMAVPLDRARHVQGGAVPIVEGVRRFTALVGSPAANFDIAANGTLVYITAAADDITYQPRLLALATRDGRLQRLPLPPQPYRYPRVSPDGTKLAVETEDAKEAIIWIYDLKRGGPATRLTFEGRNRYPVWTPDGHRITFQSDRDGDYGIFWQLADGTGPAQRLAKADSGTRYMPETWSHDGKTLVFAEFPLFERRLAARAEGGNRLAELSTDKGPTRTLLGDLRGQHSAFSPDGKWLAYESSEGGKRHEVFVQPFPPTGSKSQVSTEGAIAPVWAPDQKHLYYWANLTRQFVEVDARTEPSFTAGAKVALPISAVFEPGLLFEANYDVMPDGTFVVVIPTDDVSRGPNGPGPNTIDIVLNWLEELKKHVPAR